MHTINRDLPAKASCEIREACISGRGKGGRGTIAKILEGLASRAVAISEQLETGEITRQSTLKQLNKLVGEYQSVLGQSDKSIWERRGELQKIDAKVNQIIATLDEAIPLSLLRCIALFDKNSDELIKLISEFMRQNNLKTTKEFVQMIPVEIR